MERLKVAFYTLGCKVNQYETNAMKEEFVKENYEIVEFEEKADIYVVNTCTVTNMSDRKSRQILRRVKVINPQAILVVTGCYAQVGKEELQKIEGIDLILGNTEKKEIIEYVENFVKCKDRQEIVSDIMKEKVISEFKGVAYTEKARAMIKIQDGCDRFCSYCIIPYARGRVRSRSIQDIVKEVKKIVKKGITEIVITGIHIASYGKDFQNGVSLMDLLKEIDQVKGIKRIRLGSIEPTLIKEEFMQKLVQLEKICDHFHLSLQSGCNQTLARMNRKYTVQEFMQSVKLIRRFYPNATLTTDIIVGFPGETEGEFQKTYEFLKLVDFYKMHIFKYSQRKGTKAAIMQNQIDGKVKEERSKELIKLSNEMQSNIHQKQIGKVIEVLVEEKEGEYLKGHTTNYIVVYIKGGEIEELENQYVFVRIEDSYLDGLVGKNTRM